MTDTPKLTVLPVEVDGWCDPETGVCAVPESLLAQGAAEASDPPPED